MTKKIYDYDSHISEFAAMVENCFENSDGTYNIILDKTAFFPGGGGQEHDEGFIDGMKVLNVFEKDGLIYHTTNGNIIKKEVRCNIDYKKRFKNMQNHSGEHIVSGIIHNVYGYDNVGFHMGSDCVTLDVNGEINDEELKKTELLANEAIYKNVGINIDYPDKETLGKIDYRSKLDLNENVRIVTIENYDKCACCAPHVMRTGEIGIIKLIDCIKMKDKTRIRMLSGYDAFEDYIKKSQAVYNSSVFLSIKQDELYETVLKLCKENEEKNYENVSLKRRIFSLKYSDLKRDENICIFEENCNINELIYIANLVSENNDGTLCILSKNENSGYNYVMKSNSLNLRERTKDINSALNGRGGGSNEMIQGFFNAQKDEIENYIYEVLKRKTKIN